MSGVVEGEAALGEDVQVEEAQGEEGLSDHLRAAGRTLILCGAREQPAAVLKQAQFHDHIGDRNICANIEAALRRAAEVHAATAASRPVASSQFPVAGNE